MNPVYKTLSIVAGVLAGVSLSLGQTLQWAQTLAGANANIYHLEIGSSGDVYITGNFFGTSDFDPGPGVANLASSGTSDLFIAKYTAAGSYLWAYRIGNADSEYPMGAVVDSAGNFYVGGYFGGTVDFDPGAGVANLAAAGFNNAFVAKYNSSGGLVWARGILGSGSGYLRGLRSDSAGNIVATGTFTGTLDFDPGAGVQSRTSASNFNLFVAKYNSSGSYVWANQIDSTGSIYYPSLAIDGGNNVLVSASFSGTLDANPAAGVANIFGGSPAPAPTAFFLGKYSSSGTYAWARGVSGALADALAVGTGIAVDSSNNVVVTGNFSGTASFGAQTLSAFGDSDVFVAKYSSANAPQWAFQLGGSAFETGSSVAVDASGAIYLLGTYYGSGDYNPSPSATATLSYLGTEEDTFMAKYSSSGVYQWAHAIHSSAREFMKDITVDGASNIYVAGFVTGTTDFDVSAGVSNLPFGSAAAKYAQPSLGCVPPPSSMVGWFPLDETAGTSAANLAGGLAGSASGALPSSAGKVSWARTFNGTTDYVSVPDHAAADFGTGDFSMDAWVKTTDTHGTIVGKRSQSGSSFLGYIFMLYDGRPLLQIADSVSSYANYFPSSGASVADGQWHLLAVTVDRDSVTGGKFYVDGQLVYTFNPTGRQATISNAAPLEIGKIGSEAYLAATIDEVELFNRALAQSEIQAIFAAGANGKCK